MIEDIAKTKITMNESFFKEMLSLIPGHLYWKDRDGVFLGCNLQQAIDAGFNSIEEMIGKKDEDMPWREQTDYLREIDLRIMHTGVAEVIEELFELPDGTKKIYLSNKKPVYDDNNQVTGILGISFDITRKEEIILLNNKLKTQKEYFENIINKVPCHIYWFDRENKFIGCNQHQADSIGLKSPEEIIGTNPYDFECKEDADRITKNNLLVLETGKEILAEEPFVQKDGSVRYFISKKAPLKDENNKIIGILGISIDITAEKENELLRLEKEKIEQEKAAERAELMNFYENIIDKMPGTVYWLDREGRYLGCNENEARAIGLASRAEIVGKRNTDIEGFLVSEALDPINEQVMSTGQSMIVEEPVRLKDGSIGTYLSSKFPLFDSKGEVIGLVCISFDITEKKRQVEHRILQLQKELEAAHLTAAALAHELRTPLLAIDTTLAIINRAAKTGNQEEIENKVKSIRHEVNLANRFVDIVLTNIKQIDHIDLTKCTMKKCVTEAIERFPYNDPDDIQLIRVDADLQDFEFKGNHALMVHVLFNLIKNALYFVKKAKKGDIQIRTEEDNSHYYLFVKDNAVGIAAELLEKIFDRFYTTTGVGTGVGLSYCKMVMQLFHGSIHCNSELGNYTEFCMSFPKI